MSYLYTIIVSPLELLLEIIFSIAYKSFYNYGLAIVGVSLAVSILTLPLYHLAERVQKKERDMRIALASGIKRIREAFKGDEQYMMLSTFYRQNNYHPLYVLRGSLSLIIQVPFFIAAYHFLSNLELLHDQSFFWIANLAQPDGLISLGSTKINVLPLLMTGINVITALIYTKGFPLRDRVQLYGMATLFLVLLYLSPSGLVLYWTLNNLFSLIKTIFYKLKHPLPVLYIGAVTVSIAAVIGILYMHPMLSMARKALLIAITILIVLVPIIIKLFRRIYASFAEDILVQNRQIFQIFFFSMLLLFLMVGISIPMNLIGSSTIEFSSLGFVKNPLSYISHVALVFFGLCILWPLFIFQMSGKGVQAVLSISASILVLVTLANIFLFPGQYGLLSTTLQFDNPSLLNSSFKSFLPSLGFTLLILLVIWFLQKKRNQLVLRFALIMLIIATGATAVINGIQIQKEYQDYSKNLRTNESQLLNDAHSITPEFTLSRNGKNIVFLFLDRAMSSFFPTILEETTELQSQFEGFTYYPNTISFGQHTLQGAPAMVGGYEYTPDEINKRIKEPLIDKHNEALLVLPRLFSDNGFNVVITDPPFSNYRWEADFTPFLLYPDITVTQHLKKFTVPYLTEHNDVLLDDIAMESNLLKRRLPGYSLMKASLPIFRKFLYDKGRYFLTESYQPNAYFVDAYAQLYYLPQLTDIVDVGNNFISISNDTTHRPIYLQVPEYEPRTSVTATHTPIDEKESVLETDRMHYMVNAASLKRIGVWLDFLRSEDLYDNTKIIIVSDHGFELYNERMVDFKEPRLHNAYAPLFLVKDFEAKGPILVDDSFMTNADAPLIALDGVVEEPVNPFTNKRMKEQIKKDIVNVYEGPWEPKSLKETAFEFDLSRSFSVHSNIFVEKNWEKLDQQKQFTRQQEDNR